MGVSLNHCWRGAFAALASLVPTVAMAGDFDFSNLEFQGGGIAFVAPRYEGSKSYEAIAVPYIFPGSKSSDDDFTFSDLDGIEYHALKYGAFEAGPLAGISFGRDSDDGAKLGGLGNLDEGLVVGGFGSLRFDTTRFTASYHHQVTGDDVGGLIRLRADTVVPVARSVNLLAGIGTNYATDRYMSSYFGVSAAQSATSLAGLPVYETSAGFKDVFAGAGLEVELTDRWTARLYGEYSRLVGDAADSPVIETKDQFSGMLAITYQFGPSGSPSAAEPFK